MCVKFFEKYCARTIPTGIYILKVNKRNSRTRCEIFSNSTKKTTERCYWRRSCVFVVNFEHISHFVLVFLLLILKKYGNVRYIVKFKKLMLFFKVY